MNSASKTGSYVDSNHKSPWTPGGTIQKYSPDISYHHSSISVAQDPVHQTTIGSHDHHTPISTGSHDHHSLTTTGSNDRHNLTATGSHDHHSSTAAESPDHHSSTNTSSHYLTEGVEETLSDLYKEDSIGNTVFSKAWVLSVLVRVIKAVSIEQDQTQLEKNGGTNMNRPQPNFNSINKSDTCSEEDTSFVNEDTVGGTTASVDIDSNVLSKNMSDDGSATIPRAEVMGNDSMKKSGDGSVLELEEQLEGQLCALWDASMNEDVAKFIYEQHGVDLLLGAATRSIMPRLTEICLGILANMLCIEEICVESICADALV